MANLITAAHPLRARRQCLGEAALSHMVHAAAQVVPRPDAAHTAR